MKRNIITILLVLTALLGNSQVGLLKTEAATLALSQRATDLFKEGCVGESFTNMRKYWPLVPEEIGRIEEKSAVVLAARRQRLGRPIRSVKIKGEKILDVDLRKPTLSSLSTPPSVCSLLTTTTQKAGCYTTLYGTTLLPMNSNKLD